MSQEAGQVVWYSHLFKNFPEFVAIHTVKFVNNKIKTRQQESLDGKNVIIGDKLPLCKAIC